MDKVDRFKSILFFFILFSVYIFVFSESGLLERMKLGRDYDSLRQRIGRLENDNRELAGKIGRYSEGLYSDSDIIASGYVTGGGRIIRFDDAGIKRQESSTGKSEFDLELGHLRIIWIIFSIVLVVYYYTKRKNEADNQHGNPF